MEKFNYISYCAIIFDDFRILALALAFRGLFMEKYIFATQSIGSLQKKYSIGSFELLSKTAPIQAASLLVLGPFADYYLSGRFILEFKYSTGAIVSFSFII